MIITRDKVNCVIFTVCHTRDIKRHLFKDKYGIQDMSKFTVYRNALVIHVKPYAKIFEEENSKLWRAIMNICQSFDIFESCDYNYNGEYIPSEIVFNFDGKYQKNVIPITMKRKPITFDEVLLRMCNRM